MNSNNVAPDQLYGYDVMDQSGNKVGDVDGVWVDDATNELEFVGVKTGFLMGKTHLIPVENAQINDGSITVPFDKDQIGDAPNFGTDDELSPDDEDSIYNYYGMNRSTAPSPTGLATGGTDTTTDTTAGNYVDTDTSTGNYVNTDTNTDNQDLVLSEEELQVGKREVQTGQVRLRKIVRTEHVEQPIELRHEEVQIERVDANGMAVPDDAFQEEEIDIPVMQEEAVVAKEAHVTGRVQVNKDVEVEQTTVGGDVRREEVVEEDGTATGNQ